MHCKVPRRVKMRLSAASGPKAQQCIRSSGFQLNEILLWVFSGEILGVSLVVKRKVLAVLLVDSLHFLVTICILPPVEESGRYRQCSHNHKDDYCNDTCKVKGFCSISDITFQSSMWLNVLTLL